MSSSKNRKTLRSKITDKIIAEAVSEALRQEHADIGSAVKVIERITGIGEETASKWYRGLHTPKSAHLLTLAAYYPEVLRAFFTLLGRNDLWDEAMRLNIPYTMHLWLASNYPNYHFRGDKFVPPSLPAPLYSKKRFHPRQVWFMDEVSKGRKLQTKDIAQTWGVSRKTAKRDIAKLREAQLVRFVPSGKSGWYEVL